jgi:hypothetical protein
MREARRRLVSAFLLILICGSVYDIIRDEEHWPFSQYPMFSGIWRATSFSWYRLVGVTVEGREITLDRRQYIRPFDPSRLHLAFTQISVSIDAARRMREAVANCLDRYERLRADGEHDGPALRAMRLYLFHWKIRDDARNVDRPDARQLVLEVASPQRAAR